MNGAARILMLKGAGVFAALLFSLICGGVFISAIGKDPLQIYLQMFSESLGNPYGIGQILFKATTFIFTGLSVAVCFRSGFFNIGAEGQLMVGGLCIAVTGFSFAGLPSLLHIPLCILAGMAGGAAWGFIPGFLKARFGAHEVINTIMLNFIAAALISYLVNSVFAVPATVHTPPVGHSAELARLESLFSIFKGSPVNFSLALALLAALFVHYVLSHTRFGYELRAIGLGSRAAECAHMNVGLLTMTVTTLSGALAALGSANFVMGYKHYYEIGFSDGAGFMGIAVALLANNRPLAIPFAALFFGMLDYGGLTINTLVPKELVNILQAIVIIMIVLSMKLMDRWMPQFEKTSLPAASNG